MTIAPFIANAPDGLFSYIQQSLGSLSVPILAVVLVGVYTKKVPALGAKLVLSFGVILYLISLIILEPQFRDAAEVQAIADGITNLKEISILKANAYPHYLHVMGILFVFNIILMLIIGRLRPKKDEYIPHKTEIIDTTPWKHTVTASIIIAILVLATYFIF